MSNTIILDGEKYIKMSAMTAEATEKQIVVLDRGWVVVGDVAVDGSNLKISNAGVVRKWGTSQGLGELAEKGPLANTVIEKCPLIITHELTAVMRINCIPEAWK